MSSSNLSSVDVNHIAKPLSESSAPKEYEQLKGKTGRQALYRPDRLTLRDLVEQPGLFTLEVDGQLVRPRNFSISGLSFRSKNNVDWKLGELTQYAIALEGRSVLEGEATVARVDACRRHLEVGLSSVGVLDYELLRAAEQDHVWRTGLQRKPHILRDSLPSEYRQAVLELSSFCQFYKGLLGRRQRHQAGDVLDIAEEAFATMKEGWVELRTDASREALGFLDNAEIYEQARAISEALVTPYLVEAPVIRRSFDKPLGYPGDYVIMQHYFDNRFEGDSAFGMVFHQITNEHPLAVGVRTRSEWVAALIRDKAELVNGAAPLRVLSLGCGIGAEVGLVHSSEGAPKTSVAWTLIDQEDAALSVAYRNARKAALNGHAAPMVNCLNVSFSQLFSGEINPATWGAQDVIFAMGLFDYIPQPGAAMLLAGLYSLLRPGGTIAIGNASKPNLHFWETELALRWSLMYRDIKEMEGLAAALPPSAEVRVESERTGAYHILVCEKP